MSNLNKSNLNLEYKLIDHIANVRYEDLPPEAVKYCKLLIMDALGVTFPGSQAPGCPEVTGLANVWKSESGASVLIHGHKTIPPFAALVNSTMMHALDFDDTLDASALHTFVSVLPAAMAAAETVGSNPKGASRTQCPDPGRTQSLAHKGTAQPVTWTRPCRKPPTGSPSDASRPEIRPL